MNSYHTELHTKYADSVFRAAFKITADRDDAKDITQETFIKLFKLLDEYKPIDNPRAYLVRTAVNLSLNFNRNTKSKQDKNLTIENPTNNPTPEESVLVKENSEIIKTALRQLSEKQQEAITLRFFSELKHKEIAQIMKIVEGSVRTHINRGLEKLKMTLSPILKKEIL